MNTTTGTPQTPVTTIRVPQLFWRDHIKRQNLPAEHEKTSGHSVWLTLTEAALQDLKQDAEYYAEWEGWDYYDNRRVVDSARRTLAAIKKQVM